jgi:hypothetical protein
VVISERPSYYFNDALQDVPNKHEGKENGPENSFSVSKKHRQYEHGNEQHNNAV